jgi:hypothetical protein
MYFDSWRRAEPAQVREQILGDAIVYDRLTGEFSAANKPLLRNRLRSHACMPLVARLLLLWAFWRGILLRTAH